MNKREIIVFMCLLFIVGHQSNMYAAACASAYNAAENVPVGT